jgi:hypothetical protein
MPYRLSHQHVRPDPDAMWAELGRLLVETNAALMELGGLMTLDGDSRSRRVTSIAEDAVDALETYHVISNHLKAGGTPPEPATVYGTVEDVTAEMVANGEINQAMADLIIQANRAHDARRAAPSN